MRKSRSTRRYTEKWSRSWSMMCSLTRQLLNFKELNWHAMNSFVHSGIHPLRRHADGYAAGLIESAVRSCNGLSLMVFQLGVVLTGDPRYEGVVRATQEKYHQILPGLVSPL
ncbi:hypothetical protein ALO54_100985 [Pseudomonas syringae pv. philadelphi]|nr:hypothetical protein ALO86_100855 [Pseudomonas syringae pv. berberidis]KPY14943.1 hypothetical protein ALO54_100985 [Pseudomonas syringae pv. philadelphi]RMM20445.1 hypothetical protein ALQ83_101006 [Pseudomonas syringae pv. berberidis]RMP68073.1 hypothetical protein ALQ19_101017 [Pseudomonas syringae pv. berberidis]RMQ41802.1 hypothetical protein ALQ06_100989 [Pseudomonas syringae pv. berberidis]